MVGVDLAVRNKGISGTLPGRVFARAHSTWSPNTLHWPADGQFQLLKGAEADQAVTEVIRAASVRWIIWGSPTRWTQVADKEKLLMSIPTVLQQNILENIFNAVRIRSHQEG
jgi:hypothetical protein